MTDQHTPTTDLVCSVYVQHMTRHGDISVKQVKEGFDRWLAAHDANVLRKAAYEWSLADGNAHVYAWLHTRADQINPPRCDQIEVDND